MALLKEVQWIFTGFQRFSLIQIKNETEILGQFLSELIIPVRRAKQADCGGVWTQFRLYEVEGSTRYNVHFSHHLWIIFISLLSVYIPKNTQMSQKILKTSPQCKRGR